MSRDTGAKMDALISATVGESQLAGAPAFGDLKTEAGVEQTFLSGRCRARTCDPLRVRQVLSQLS